MNFEVTPEIGYSDFFFAAKRKNAFAFPHVHSHLEFIFSLSGELFLSVDGEQMALPEGQVAIILPYQIHSYTASENSEVFFLACPPEYISDYSKLFHERRFSPSHAPFGVIARRLIDEIALLEAQDYLKNKALVYYTLADLVAHCSLFPVKRAELDVYRRAIIYISSHYKEEITLTEVARHLQTTPVHLSRTLNSRNQAGFSDLLNSLRIFEAKRMLEQTALPISSIAYEVGYGSIRNFNRIFIKYFGRKPSEIRTGREGK